MRECPDEGILQSYFDGELSRQLAEGVASHLASCSPCAQAAREWESESLLLAEALRPEFAVSVPSERLRESIDAAIAELQVGPERASVVAGTPAVPVVRRWAQSIAEWFTLTPQRSFGYAGLAAVILFATIVGGIYWRQAGRVNKNQDKNSIVAVIPSASPTPLFSKGAGGPADSGGGSKPPAKKKSPLPSGRKEIVKLLPGERSYLKTIASLDATIKAESNRQMKASLQVEYERNLAMVDQAIAATRTAAKVNPSDPDAAEFMFAAYQSKIDLLSQVADSRLSNRQH